MDHPDDAKPTAISITSAYVTPLDKGFLDEEEYARCEGRWCHSVSSDRHGPDGDLIHELITPDYVKAVQFATAMAREHHCVIRDHSQMEP